MLIGISILLSIRLCWNCVKLEEFCIEENGIQRELNHVWIRNGCQCKCEILRDKIGITCNECAEKSEKLLMVLPDGLDGYFSDKDMEVYCNFDNGRLEINTTEGFRNSNNSMNIGGDYNDSNETICASCVTSFQRSSLKCYKMIGYAPDLYFDIPTNFYPIGRNLTIKCELRPKGISKYFHNIVVMTQINDSVHSGYLNGVDHGEICFVCKHQCPACTILSSIYNCFKPLNILYLTPNKSSEYSTNKTLMLHCLPDNNARLHINLKNVNFTSDSSVELKNISKTVCAYCSSFYFTNPKTCYLVKEMAISKDDVDDTMKLLDENLMKERITELRSNVTGRKIYLFQKTVVNLSIIPIYLVYLRSTPMKIICLVHPQKFKDTQYNVTLISLNATALTISRFEMQITGTDRSTICFQCGSSSTNFTIRCYKYYNQNVSVTIGPQKTSVFFRKTPLDVFCQVIPSDLINFMEDIFLEGDDPQLIRIDGRSLRIESVIHQKICFYCGNKVIKNATKCYELYTQDVIISIEPSSPPYYYKGQRIQVTCIVKPPDIFQKVQNIEIIWHNTSFKKDTDLSLTLTGKYVGDIICVLCGNILIYLESMCYEYLDTSNPSIDFIPKYQIFLPNVQMTVACILSPKEFYKPQYGFSLSFKNASGMKLSGLEFVMNGLNTDTVCFNCSGTPMKSLVKCYSLYSAAISLSIDPNSKYVYPPVVLLDVYCRVKPDEVVTKNLITDIMLNSNASKVTRVGSLHFNIPNIQSQTQFCFTCGNRVIANISKCYMFMGNVPTFEIYPAATFLFFRNPTTLTCNVTPANSALTKFSFDLFFLNTSYYTNVNQHVKTLSVNIPFDNHQICLTCGVPVTNITKCYILKKQDIVIEIIPKVNYYLVYDDTMDVICQVSPIKSLPNFPGLGFTKMSLSYYKVITQRHYKICHPKSRCAGKFCFTCADPQLPTVFKCYKPWTGTVNFFMTPRNHILFYMEPHLIVCHVDKPFTKNESIKMDINGLKLNEYTYIPAEMTIKILPLHYLLNRRVIAVCGTNFPTMKANHIYNLTGAVNLDYDPNFLIFMGFYQNFRIVTYFTFAKKNYSANCVIISQIPLIRVTGSVIELFRYLGSGTYHFRCPFPNTTSIYIFSLNVLNISVQSRIEPQGPTLYYIYNSLVECIYVPFFVPFSRIDKRVIGLNPSDYTWRSSGMEIAKKLSLRGAKVCITCRFSPMFINTKCYNLKANISFIYHPVMDYYIIYYQDYYVVTYFKHRLLAETFQSTCRMKSGSHQLNILGGNITLAIPLWSGTYLVECYPPNSTEMTELQLKVFSDPINLIIYPPAGTIVILDTVRIYCEVQPSLNLGMIILSTMQSFLHGNDSSEKIIPNSVLFRDRCLCFSCNCAKMSSVRQCYNFTTPLILRTKPKQNLYFAWNRVTIETYFINQNKPGRKYLAMCSLPYENFSVSNLGEIHISPMLVNLVYDFHCTIPTVVDYQILTLFVYSNKVELEIIPNNTDIYIFSMVMEVECIVKPDDLNVVFPAIKFLSINSTQYVYKAYRLILIGGVDYDVKDIICVVCGHDYLPFNVSRCFSPYTGDINVTILPLEWEIYYLMPHTITCKIVPQFSNYSKVSFFVIGIPKSSYKVSSDLTIRINSDKTLISKDICVICGNRPTMNKSRCYRLASDDESRCFDYVIVLTIMLTFLVLAVYISTYEVM